MEDFDDNAFATHSRVERDAHVSTKRLESIKAYQRGVEAAWSTTTQLLEAVELVIQEAWQQSLLPRVEEEDNGEVDIGPSTGSHQKMGLCYLNYLEALAMAWQQFCRQELTSSDTFMSMLTTWLDKWPSSIQGD
jgi:hypothetical protein